MTLMPTSLPPPGASQQEVLFRRMLLQCSLRIQHQAAGQGAGKDWRTDAKFHCVVEALQEKLYDLEHAGAEVQPGADVMQQYAAAVKAIAAQLQQPELPSYCLRVAAQDRLPVAEAGAAHMSSSSQQGHKAGHPADGQQHSYQARQQQQHTSGHANGRADAAAAAGGGGGGSGREQEAPNFSLSSSAQHQLATQQRLRDELVDELADMGQELKRSTLAMQNAIRYRGKLLDDTEVSLVNSTESAKAAATKAKEQYRQGQWNLCHTLIIVLSVFVIFSFMLVAIRVSSFVGLKGS